MLKSWQIHLYLTSLFLKPVSLCSRYKLRVKCFCGQRQTSYIQTQLNKTKDDSIYLEDIYMIAVENTLLSFLYYILTENRYREIP